MIVGSKIGFSCGRRLHWHGALLTLFCEWPVRLILHIGIRRQSWRFGFCEQWFSDSDGPYYSIDAGPLGSLCWDWG